MKTPADKLIGLSILSYPAKKAAMRWSARLIFRPGTGPDGSLEIRMNDGENVPVGRGVFEFAGLMTEIRDGAGSIAYADFIRGKHETNIWLHRRGMPPVPGRLAFG